MRFVNMWNFFILLPFFALVIFFIFFNTLRKQKNNNRISQLREIGFINEEGAFNESFSGLGVNLSGFEVVNSLSLQGLSICDFSYYLVGGTGSYKKNATLIKVEINLDVCDFIKVERLSSLKFIDLTLYPYKKKGGVLLLSENLKGIPEWFSFMEESIELDIFYSSGILFLVSLDRLIPIDKVSTLRENLKELKKIIKVKGP